MQIIDHTFRTDVVGTIDFFYITTTCILVITTQSFEYFTNSNIQRIKSIRIDSYFVLLQITAKTVDFDNTGNARKLSFYNPVLNSTQLHSVVTVFIAWSYFKHILVNFTQTSSNRHQLRSTQFRWYFA